MTDKKRLAPEDEFRHLPVEGGVSFHEWVERVRITLNIMPRYPDVSDEAFLAEMGLNAEHAKSAWVINRTPEAYARCYGKTQQLRDAAARAVNEELEQLKADIAVAEEAVHELRERYEKITGVRLPSIKAAGVEQRGLVAGMFQRYDGDVREVKLALTCIGNGYLIRAGKQPFFVSTPEELHNETKVIIETFVEWTKQP